MKICRYCHHREHWGLCSHRVGGTAYACKCSHQPEIPVCPLPPGVNCGPDSGVPTNAVCATNCPEDLSAQIESLKRDNISLAEDYEGAKNRAQENARLLGAVLAWMANHEDNPIPPQALIDDCRAAVDYAFGPPTDNGDKP